MASSFTENTRVQVPAALHLCKLGYTYLDNIQEYDARTNILTDVFIRSVKRLNPLINDLECQQLIDKIAGMVNNDDLGREFYSLLSANSGLKLARKTTNGMLLLSFHVRMQKVVITSGLILLAS